MKGYDDVIWRPNGERKYRKKKGKRETNKTEEDRLGKPSQVQRSEEVRTDAEKS